MPPKPPKEFESKLNNIDTVYVIMLNVAFGATIWGVLQSDRGRDKFSSYFAESQISRRLSAKLSARMPKNVENFDVPDATRVSLDPKLTAPVSKSEIICVSTIAGSGFSTALFNEMKDKEGVLWIDARTIASTGTAVVNALGGESPLLRVVPCMQQLVGGLEKYATSSSNGLTIVVDHSNEVQDSLASLFRDLLADFSMAASKPGSKIKIILVNPSVEALKASLSVKPGKVSVTNFRGALVSDISEWGKKKLSSEDNAAEKISMLLDICGPDLRCLSDLISNPADTRFKVSSKVLLDTCIEVRQGLLSARDPRTQLAQLFTLDYICRPQLPFSPPATIAVEGLYDYVEAQLTKVLSKSALNSKNGLTTRQATDRALANLEKSGLLWRCLEDGTAVANESAPAFCLKKRGIVASWNGMREERWVDEIKKAAVKASK